MGTVHDRLTATLNTTETTEKSLGTITLPKDAKKIIAVYGYAVSTASGTVDETSSGYFRLTGKNIKNDHYFPISLVFTGDHTSQSQMGGFIPVNIDVGGNETIEVFMALDMAMSVNQTGVVFVVYEA